MDVGKYPVISFDLKKTYNTTCALCNRGRDKLSVITSLGGDRYHRKYLYQLQGSTPEEIPNAFPVGKFCKRRLEIFHEIYHFKHSTSEGKGFEIVRIFVQKSLL